VCAPKSSQYLCNRIMSPHEESLLGKQGVGEKKIRCEERKRAVPKGGHPQEGQGVKGGERERERERERDRERERGSARRRIMKTTMGERTPLKLVQFCSRRRAMRTTTTTRATMMAVVAAQYRV